MYEIFFAKRLTALREQKGVSAREMSLAIGQNSSYINRIENQKAFPSMQVFFYICEYLEISPCEFFDDGNKNPTRLSKIIGEMKQLDDAHLETVLAVVRGFQKNN